MFTQNFPASLSFGQVLEPLPAQKPTSGGSSEIEKNDPIATPTGWWSTIAVTTHTPVGKWPSTCRKWALSKAGSVIGTPRLGLTVRQVRRARTGLRTGSGGDSGGGGRRERDRGPLGRGEHLDDRRAVGELGRL